MQYNISASTYLNSVLNKDFSTPGPQINWSIDVDRLWYDKEILEYGLANCATYLITLRKKLARNERLLSKDLPPPRKKRKRLQQEKHKLGMEIKYRERDEQAFLNNLYDCNAKIHFASGLLPTQTNFLMTDSSYASSSAQCSYEDSSLIATEISWNGWADDVVTSPFEKERKNAFFSNEIAPDELADESEECLIVTGEIERPFTIIQDAEPGSEYPVPPNTAHSESSPFLLSPMAVVFEPTLAPVEQHDRLSISPSYVIECQGLVSPRRYTEGAMSESFPALVLQMRSNTDSYKDRQGRSLVDVIQRKGFTGTRRSRGYSL
ncbi:hypothetical protein GQ44DRAFT_701701 [Phaeosphaeriaceae sp. PMI808]|nr:hypothetical protein GQ44DRAFT_701701 [Phaeosphaeriaceae sp. PMI808]